MAKTLPAPLWDSPRCACPRKATLSIAILQMPTSPDTSGAGAVAEGLVVAQPARPHSSSHCWEQKAICSSNLEKKKKKKSELEKNTTMWIRLMHSTSRLLMNHFPSSQADALCK